MEKKKTNKEIKKGIKYGVYNITDKFVETHHRSQQAANRQCKKRQNHWGKEKKFEVVELLK